MPSSAAKPQRLGHACDRCYELKARCIRISAAIDCKRCNRLAQKCLTLRPVRPAGRRVQVRTNAIADTLPGQQTSAAEAQDDSCKIDTQLWNLGPDEKKTLLFFLAQPDTFEYCVVCPSFNKAEQRSFAAPLPAALPVLKDAYLACAGALKPPYLGPKTEVDSAINLRHASSALKTLRSLPVGNYEEAAICLTLGTALALFVYSAVGVGLFDICHSSLSKAEPFLDMAMLDPDTKPLVTFLVLLETMTCFVDRQKPTLRIQMRKAERVDRHLGLCLPLLPYYYDLCEINHALAVTTDEKCLARILHTLDGIQAAVDRWQPSQPDDFIDKFSSADIVHLLAQAKVYRLAALLVSHRLRYVFGQQDNQADIWSKEIMRELELARRVTSRLTRFVTLPFLVAAVEIRGVDERIETLQNVAKYVDQFTPVIQKVTRTFLARVWRERDVAECSWFDLVYKPCVFLDAMDEI
ncbi:hypothetical protein BP6252_03925 [Coleophoma cylindrospora]|uniref:Zn(2)-C6 fungal-type domain-containing protein n=1 Tax=Coleophoma cylindrospora TaxID=1849047 RepID=A0A3D8S953_9HELO|nr:hypothetical protein BP6252_03925 [Coleophoma cylindrospora]